jgi:hypothetical protein
MLTDADIDAWLTAIGGYRAEVPARSVVSEGCYLITQAQGRADLAHPNGQWTLDASVGGAVRIRGTSAGVRGPCLQVPIPGTSWSLSYLAWHVRKPSVPELAWVLHDLLINWSQPPPARPPSAYLVR